MATAPAQHIEPAARVNDYDDLAERYSARNEAWIVNAYYERPAACGHGQVDEVGSTH